MQWKVRTNPNKKTDRLPHGIVVAFRPSAPCLAGSIRGIYFAFEAGFWGLILRSLRLAFYTVCFHPKERALAKINKPIAFQIALLERETPNSFISKLFSPQI